MFIKKKNYKFLFFFFCFNIFSSISQTSEGVLPNNIAINEIPRSVSSTIFEDFSGKEVNLKDYQGKLIVLNFWATWCRPCKKEMPSLDKLKQNKKFKNLEVFAVNIEESKNVNIKTFFEDLNIKELSIFFDKDLNLVNEFKLRGVPTTILINKNGEEFARIIGSIDFEDKFFLQWLSKYD